MVQWELQTANGAVKVAIVACNTLVFGNSMHMLGPLGQWNPSQHRHFMACECQTIDHDGMARDHLQVSEKRGTPLSTLPWRLFTNWFTDCAWHCICVYVYTITVPNACITYSAKSWSVASNCKLAASCLHVWLFRPIGAHQCSAPTNHSILQCHVPSWMGSGSIVYNYAW